MIDDLLDIARVAEGKLELQKARIDVRVVIDDAVAATSTLFQEHRHELSVVLSDTVIWLDADRTRLLQVFANLLTNAAKFTKDGGRISMNVQSDGTIVAIRVRDNGQGIAPETLPHVFDLFMQGASGQRGGLGIGLRVVRELVASHGGTVSAYSDSIDQGSEFIVTLPVEP